jgi:hypothetical protein
MTDSSQPGPGNTDVAQAAFQAVSDSLLPRGYLTTEWWTTIVGGALSAVLAVVHISASSATHVVAVLAPALLAALYAITRTMHKSALASVLRDVFPQAAAASTPPVAAGQAAQIAGQSQVATTATTQTDPDFVFEGIPPIEEPDG